MAGAFLDVAESGTTKKSDNGIGLYNDMLAIFLQVASPFTNYQKAFDELEAKHLEVATHLVSKDMQETAGSVSSTAGFEELQDATERLKDLAPFIFPMTEGSLDRFELLNGGYQVGPALSAVDKILTQHVGELVIAIRTLSAAMIADVEKVADMFDEQYVMCAMEVLKLAGNLSRDLRGFEMKTRERLFVMSERMIAHLKHEMEIQKAASNKLSKAGSFSLPDAISIVEIDSVLTKVFCGEDEANDEGTSTSLLVLQRLSGTPDVGPPMELFPEAEGAIKRLVNSCHTFVFDVCSSVPRKHLGGILEMTAWKEKPTDDAFDSYGTLPQQYITQVGEHMLALVQAFEPFAADPETLSLANEVMDGVRNVALQPWGEFVASAGIIDFESIVGTLMDGREITELVLNNAALTEEDAELEEGISDDERASAAFCNAWLDVVGLAVTGRLLERVMRIPQLTHKGCEHLSADLNYLVNVFSALGVAGHPHPLITHLAEVANLSDNDLLAHISTRDPDNAIEAALRAIEVRVALLRGVSVS